MIRQRRGRIINFSSNAGLRGVPGYPAYSPAKAGVIALTRVLAVEWGPFGICTNALAPGFAKTPFNAEILADPALGLEVSWEGGEFVMVLAHRGLVSCGILDKALMDGFGEAVAIARGSPEAPLITVEDLLSARIVEATAKAQGFGVWIGMTGREALERLSDVHGTRDQEPRPTL